MGAFVLMAVFARGAERVVWQQRGEGIVLFQAQQLKEGVAYRLKILDLQDDQVLDEWTFSLKARERTLSYSWTVPAESGLAYYQLYRGDELLQDSRPVDPVRIQTRSFFSSLAEMDRRGERIVWQVPTHALARVVAMTTTGLHIRELEAWHFVSGGHACSASWDFWDRDRKGYYGDHSALRVNVQYFNIPRGLIIYGRPYYADYAHLPYFKGLVLPEEKYQLSVKVLGAELIEESGSVGAGSSLRVHVSEETATLLQDEVYEVVVFWDGEFIHEETNADIPLIFTLPEIQTQDGLHSLSINIRDFHNNFGIDTLPLHWVSARKGQR